MKINKFGAAALCLAPMFAYAGDSDGPKVYGKLHVSAAHVAEDAGEENSALAVASHASRLGVKGKEEISEGFTAIYKIEFQVDTVDEGNASSNHIKSRDQYVGVEKGNLTIRAGRISTPYKGTLSKIDAWGDTYIDHNNVVSPKVQGISADARRDNALQVDYSNDNGVSFGIAYAAGDDSAADENMNDAISAAFNYSADNFTVGVAIDQAEYNGEDSVTAIKVGGLVDLDKVDLGLVLESISDDDDGTEDVTTAFAKVGYEINDSNKLIATYGQIDSDDLDDSPAFFSLGVQHKYSKKSSAYAYVGSGSNDGLAAKAKLDGDSTVLAVGMVHKF